MLIVVIEPGRPPIECHCRARDVVVGRSPSSDVVVDRPHVSSRHLRILGGVVAHDLGSTNGSFLDGRSLERPEWIVDRRLTLGGPDIVLRVVTTGQSLVAGAHSGCEREVSDEDLTATVPNLEREAARDPRPRGSATEFFGFEALRFVGDVEAIVARMTRRLAPSDGRSAADRKREGRARELFAAVVAHPHDARPRERFAAHLEELRLSLEESSSAYQRASVRLVDDVRVSLGPRQLAGEEPLPKLSRALGREDAELYRRARVKLDALTPEVVAARLDDLVRAALDE